MAEYMMEFLSNILSVMNNWIVLILLLMLQYYLMKRPEKRMQLVLPVIYFMLAIVDAALVFINGDISIPNQGIVIEVSAIILAAMTFLIGNLNTLLFVIVYKKHNASKGSLAITLIAVFLIGCILAAAMIYVLSFSMVLNRT